MWWKLIHDQSTPMDRLWARKQRATAEASGTPLHQIPGWARDKELAQAVRAATIVNGRAAIGHRPTGALRPADHEETLALPESSGAGDARSADAQADGAAAHNPGAIEARILDVKVEVDEELEAYNRYLFELHVSAPPKRWNLLRHRSRADQG